MKREVKPEDIEHIESFTLEDHAKDLSHLEFPQNPGRLSDKQVDALADHFVATLEP